MNFPYHRSADQDVNVFSILGSYEIIFGSKGLTLSNRSRTQWVMKASARHILVDNEQFCADLKSQIQGGADFADLAREHSQCPSGQSGGELGTFRPGQMVREFDTVVFNDEVGVVHGPVKTQFGYHLVEVTARG